MPRETAATFPARSPASTFETSAGGTCMATMRFGRIRIGHHPPVAGVRDIPEREKRQVDRRKRAQEREVVGGGIGVADMQHRRGVADQEADVLLRRASRRVVADAQHVHRRAADLHTVSLARRGQHGTQLLGGQARCGGAHAIHVLFRATRRGSPEDYSTGARPPPRR